MRKLVVILLVAMVVPTAAFARNRDKGDGTLAIKDASATIQIIGKGTILGRVDQGTITVTDLNPNDNTDPQVFGYDRQITRNELTTTYRGKNIRFRFLGGRYTIRLTGSGIDVAAVGTGRVRLTGGGTLDDGVFSFDGASLKAIPSSTLLGTFGDQTASSPIPIGG